MSPFVPPPEFVIHETEHWWVNHRCDTIYPGYLMVAAKSPCAVSLPDTPPDALAQLGPLLRESVHSLELCLKPIRTYCGAYGHSHGHTLHFHVIPVYDWTVDAYWRDERYRSLQQFYSGPPADLSRGPNAFDGADMLLFIWREFAERPNPPEVNGPSVEKTIRLLRNHFMESSKSSR